MDKFLARQLIFSPSSCDNVCVKCKDCKRNTQNWTDCWKDCDECNRCSAIAYRNDIYDDPYYYQAPWYKRSIATTPLAKQFCDNICGVNMCKAYRDQYDGYMQCKRCEQKSQCWSQYQSKCVQCPSGSRPGQCERKWGCPNPKGSQFGYVTPIDPMYTDCQPCWNPRYYNT